MGIHPGFPPKQIDTDDLLNELHDLKIDLKDMTIAYEEERKEVENIEKENDRLSEELDRLSSKIDTIDTKQEADSKEIARVRDELNEAEKFYRTRLAHLDGNYLKALSVMKTIECGNMDFFRSREGEEFLRWASREFEQEALRKFNIGGVRR